MRTGSRLVAVGSAVATSACMAFPAQGVPPERTFFQDQQTNVVSDLCGFDITVRSTFPGTRQVDFYDQDGALTRTTYHVVEQDTFTANGKTLEGSPYRFNSVLTFGADGEITSAHGSGLAVKVPLPDGNTFLAAGRVDFFQQEGDFIFVPDSGTSKNRDAFCAALAA